MNKCCRYLTQLLIGGKNEISPNKITIRPVVLCLNVPDTQEQEIASNKSTGRCEKIPIKKKLTAIPGCKIIFTEADLQYLNEGESSVNSPFPSPVDKLSINPDSLFSILSDVQPEHQRSHLARTKSENPFDGAAVTKKNSLDKSV